MKAISAVCLAMWLVSATAGAKTTFGITPRVTPPATLIAKVEQQVVPHGVAQLHLGMEMQQVFSAVPGLDRKGLSGFDGREHGIDLGGQYLLRHLIVVAGQGRVTQIEFAGGHPVPHSEMIQNAVEWLVVVFGTPATVFEQNNGTRDGRFGLIWKEKEIAVAAWFSVRGSSFYAYLKIVRPDADMEKILSARGGRDLATSTPAIRMAIEKWTRVIAQLDQIAKPSPSVPVSARLASPTPPHEYELLIGEGLAGSGFLIQHESAYLAVCSIHQFDGKVPGSMEPLEGPSILLDRAKVFKQRDVQVLPVKANATNLQFLAYNPNFTLRPGDAVLILGPIGDVMPGTLTSSGMSASGYKSSQGPRVLEIRTSKEFTAAGGSGGPIIHKATAAVIGVLLGADHPEKARTVSFETLCIPKAEK